MDGRARHRSFSNWRPLGRLHRSPPAARTISRSRRCSRAAAVARAAFVARPPTPLYEVKNIKLLEQNDGANDS